MVSRDSAVHATPEDMKDDIFSIDADHSNMVKFESKSCQNYINVRTRIIEFAWKAQSVIRQRYDEGMNEINCKREHSPGNDDCL